MTERKWLKECHAWLDDPDSVQYKTDQGNWHQPADGNYTPIRHPYLTWRLKPKTITINGEEIEAPDGGPYAVMIQINNHYVQNRDQFSIGYSTPEARDAGYKKLVEAFGS